LNDIDARVSITWGFPQTECDGRLEIRFTILTGMSCAGQPGSRKNPLGCPKPHRYRAMAIGRDILRRWVTKRHPAAFDPWAGTYRLRHPMETTRRYRRCFNSSPRGSRGISRVKEPANADVSSRPPAYSPPSPRHKQRPPAPCVRARGCRGPTIEGKFLVAYLRKGFGKSGQAGRANTQARGNPIQPGNRLATMYRRCTEARDSPHRQSVKTAVLSATRIESRQTAGGEGLGP